MSVEITHQCPPIGESKTPCCGYEVFELIWNDRITVDPRLVTCTALPPVRFAPDLHVMIGIPGSGKSRLAAEMLRVGEVDVVISSDGIREELTGDAGDVSADAITWPLYYHRISCALASRMNVIADATHLTPRAQHDIMKFRGDAKLIAHVMVTPLGVAFARNEARDRKVPDDVILKMWHQAQLLHIPGLRTAGFDVVFVHDTEGNTEEV